MGNANLVYRHNASVLPLLETLCTVAELGSITRAAEHLNLTQPAVTRQLRSLERQLGVVLLTRTPQGVTLTAVGHAVLPHARQALAATRALQQAAHDASSSQTRRLRIAAGLMVMLYVLPPVVSAFQSEHPLVEVDLQPLHQRLALERLLEYEADAAVIASPVRSAQVRAVPILHDPLLVVTAHPNSGGSESVALEDLQGHTVLVLPATTGLYEQVAAALRERHVEANLVEYPTAETIKTAVALGMGSTVLPLSAVRDELSAGRLAAQTITGWPGGERVIHVLVRSEGHIPDHVNAFVSLLHRHYTGKWRERGGK
jgi:LysR family transcriptional regulator, nitrogen assimilation regulatory protein